MLTMFEQLNSAALFCKPDATGSVHYDYCFIRHPQTYKVSMAIIVNYLVCKMFFDEAMQ